MPILANYTLWIKDARLSFPHVLQPKAVNQGPPKYSANFIVANDSEAWREATQLVEQLAQDKWQQHAQNILQMIGGDKRLRCYGPGSDKVSQSTGQIYDGFTGDVSYLSASSDTPPQLFDPQRQEVTAMSGGNTMFVGGNYVEGLIRFWPQENQHGRAIRAQLIGVQYIREGEHFGQDEIDAATVFGVAPGAPAPTAPAPGMPAPAPAPAVPKVDDFL